MYFILKKNSLKVNEINKRGWDNWIPTCKRRKLNPFLTSYTKMNSKWITENVRPKTIKVLEENIVVSL